MADYGGGDDDAIDDAILRKYFGVHDKSLRELYTSTSSDATFYKLAERIERKSLKSNKTVKHRIECWLRKLCQQTSNYDWKKNRNHYAELLLDMLERGKLEFPFDKRPEEGPLKTLPSYLRPFAAAGPRSQGGPPKHASSKDGSAKPDRRDDVVHIASAAVDVLHDRNISRSVLSSVDGNSISGFRYDAEIQLGACRERCLELEMQVTARNDKIARLEKELIRARSDHRRDVHKYKTKINALKETYTKNLGKIIKRYTLHFKNNAARARAREADSEKQRDVPDDDRPRDEESLETAQYADFLTKFQAQMQLLKKNLVEKS